MKFPKITNRYCSKCKVHTEHKIATAKRKSPNSARPLGQNAKPRTGFGKGYGNLGRYGSKPAVGSFKMTGKKMSKKVDIRYTCSKCKRTATRKQGFRAKKLEFQ